MLEDVAHELTKLSLGLGVASIGDVLGVLERVVGPLTAHLFDLAEELAEAVEVLW